MKICILMGSPRLNGNTSILLKPFIDELTQSGAFVEYITLSDKKIASCKGCYHCQNILDDFGCIQEDDMQSISKQIADADCFVLATPIYAWYCTSEMKAAIDRCTYAMNKFYGSRGTGSLWRGKKCAIIATCGYDLDHGAGVFEEGMKRLFKHSHLNYIGMYAVQDTDDKASFQTDEAVKGAREFAKTIMKGVY